MFLEKTKLKYDSSNDAGWVHNLRIILTTAQKNYVLDPPLGNPPAPANVDVVNACQLWTEDH